MRLSSLHAKAAEGAGFGARLYPAAIICAGVLPSPMHLPQCRQGHREFLTHAQRRTADLLSAGAGGRTPSLHLLQWRNGQQVDRAACNEACRRAGKAAAACL